LKIAGIAKIFESRAALSNRCLLQLRNFWLRTQKIQIELADNYGNSGDPGSFGNLLAGYFLQLLLVHIKVGVDVLDVVVVFHRFQQTNHLVGGWPFEFDVILWNHANF